MSSTPTVTSSDRYPFIARAIYDTPWAIHPQKLAEIHEFIQLKIRGGDVSEESLEKMARSPRAGYAVHGTVAILPLRGVIVHRGASLLASSGMTSVEAFRNAFQEALGDGQVESILIDVDSPGGAVDGIPELADEIRTARGDKPIVAAANVFAASGAYWLASQADELVVSPSGEVGHIGVRMMHINQGSDAPGGWYRGHPYLLGPLQGRRQPIRGDQ